MASFLWVENVRRFEKLNVDIYVGAASKAFAAFENLQEEADEMAAQSELDPESAFEEAAGYYVDMVFAYQAIRGLVVAGLYHLWERQVRNFLYQELSRGEVIEQRTFCRDFRAIKEQFVAYGVDLEMLGCYEELEKLNLLANTVKHGYGQSFLKLYERAPEFFPNTHDPQELVGFSDILMNGDIIVTQEQFRTLVQAVKLFWDELPDRCYPNRSE